MKTKYIEHFDDERDNGNGVIVTLRWGWSYYASEHSGVQGFDTVGEARNESTRANIYPCACPLCIKGIEDRRTNKAADEVTA